MEDARRPRARPDSVIATECGRGAPRDPRRTAAAALLAALAAGACASGRGDVAPASAAPAAGAGPVRPAAVPATAVHLDGPLRLERLLPLLLARNPRILAARARLEAAAELHPQAISLPDPMAEVRGFTRNAMAPGESFTRYDVMIRQDFPFPTVLALRGDAAEREAQAEALRYEAAVRDAVTELKEVHAERRYLSAAERVRAAVCDVYRRFAELARSGMSTGRTRLPESFRAEALLAQAGYERTLLAELRAVEDQRLRSLLALDARVAPGEPDDTPPPAAIDLDVAALTARALEHNQELRAAGVETGLASLGERLARWDWAPRFSLGAGRMVNDDFEMATGERRDSTTVSFGLTLPVWAGAKSAAVREAEARTRAAAAAETGERERVAADVARTAFRLRNASRLALLYERELVPQAEQALLRSEALVAEGKESLASSLELAATWQQLRIAGLRARADEEQALAALERVLGASLAPVPAPAPAEDVR